MEGLGSIRRVAVVALPVGAVVALLGLAVIGSSWESSFQPVEDRVVGPESSLRPRVEPGFGVDDLVLVGALAAAAAVLVAVRNRRVAVPLLVLTAISGAAIVVAFGLLPDRVVGEGGLGAGGGGPGRERVIDEAGAPSVVLTVVVVLVAVAAWVLTRQRVAGPEGGPEADGLAEAIDSLAEDLAAERGAGVREEIVLAYGRLEQLLAGRGRPRARAETTAEYSTRVLRDLGAVSGRAEALAEIYQGAAFGLDDVGLADQRRAASLLRDVAEEIGAVAAPVDPPTSRPT